jgi:hypothetical protein
MIDVQPDLMTDAIGTMTTAGNHVDTTMMIVTIVDIALQDTMSGTQDDVREVATPTADMTSTVVEVAEMRHGTDQNHQKQNVSANEVVHPLVTGESAAIAPLHRKHAHVALQRLIAMYQARVAARQFLRPRQDPAATKIGTAIESAIDQETEIGIGIAEEILTEPETERAHETVRHDNGILAKKSTATFQEPAAGATSNETTRTTLGIGAEVGTASGETTVMLVVLHAGRVTGMSVVVVAVGVIGVEVPVGKQTNTLTTFGGQVLTDR